MTRPKIFLVDDDFVMRMTAEVMLEGQPLDLVTFESPAEILARLEAGEKPDVFLVDFVMPGMDGTELCRRIRRLPGMEKVPIIVLTAFADGDNLVKALESGADEFIAKPVAAGEFRARIGAMLRLKRLYDREEEIRRQMESMMHTLVHDMRHPLTLLIGNALLLREEIPADALPRLDAIDSACQRLRRFTDQILQTAKMEEGKLALHPQSVDLAALVKKATEAFKVIATARQVELVADVPAEPVIAAVDANMVVRCVENLLDNALKFSGRSGGVVVKVAPAAGGHVEIAVADTGPGIPANLQERIFEKFGAAELKHAGVSQIGIGLSFCRLVADLHGGAIRCASREPRGSVFTLRMPATAGTAAESRSSSPALSVL